MALGQHRQTRDRPVSAPAHIIPILLLLGLSPFALSGLPSGLRPDPAIVQSPKSGDATALLNSYWPDSPESGAGPEDAMGGLVDSFIDSKSSSSQDSTGIVDYVAARCRGSGWTGMSPEETSRRLFALADDLERESGDAVRIKGTHPGSSPGKTLAVLARYHARKILCATHLALFYGSGDDSALHAAMSHAAAGLEIWERLVRLVDTHNAVPALPAAAGISRCKEALPFVRHDVARLQEVREIFERYGLFDRGLDFGPSAIQEGGPRKKALARSYAVEHRFLPLEPGMTYLQQRGYGWLDTSGISSSPAIPLPDFNLGENRSQPLLLPSDALYRDFLRGRARSTLRLDLPDGDYRVTAILANQAELAAGSFLIRTLGKDAPAGSISYAAGETGDKSMEVGVSGARLALEFVPEPGKDWLLSGLIVTRRAPHIGHIPVYSASPGSTTTFTATITAPEGIYSADLHLAVQGRVFTNPMQPGGVQFTSQVHWLPAWTGAEAAYYITALDRAGHAFRRPPAGAFQVRIHTGNPHAPELPAAVF